MIRVVPFEALSAGQREAAADILVRAFAHAPAAWHTLEDARAQVATFVEHEDRAALAALDGEAVVGWIGRVRTYSHAFELHPIAVDPEHQRRGVGRALLAALETLVASEGALTLYLGADDDFGGTSLFSADPTPTCWRAWRASRRAATAIR